MRKTAVQFLSLCRQGIKTDLTDLSRIISPFLFATTLLLIFNFAIGEVPDELQVKLFVVEVYLASLFSIQLVLVKVFEPEFADSAFEIIKVSGVSRGAWFFAKYIQTLVLSSILIAPTIGLASVFLRVSFDPSLLIYVL